MLRLLAVAADQVGMGRGLGVHKALDQIGAVAGPLLVAAMIAASAGALWPGLAVLALPGVVAVLLVRTRHIVAVAATQLVALLLLAPVTVRATSRPNESGLIAATRRRRSSGGWSRSRSRR